MALFNGGQFDPNDAYDNYVYDECTKNSNWGTSSGGSSGGGNCFEGIVALLILGAYWWPTLFLFLAFAGNGPLLSLASVECVLVGLIPIVYHFAVIKRRKTSKEWLVPIWIILDISVVWFLAMLVMLFFDKLRWMKY